jgi:hypothetical protein
MLDFIFFSVFSVAEFYQIRARMANLVWKAASALPL